MAGRAYAIVYDISARGNDIFGFARKPVRFVLSGGDISFGNRIARAEFEGYAALLSADYRDKLVSVVFVLSVERNENHFARVKVFFVEPLVARALHAYLSGCNGIFVFVIFKYIVLSVRACNRDVIACFYGLHALSVLLNGNGHNDLLAENVFVYGYGRVRLAVEYQIVAARPRNVNGFRGYGESTVYEINIVVARSYAADGNRVSAYLTVLRVVVRVNERSRQVSCIVV